MRVNKIYVINLYFNAYSKYDCYYYINHSYFLINEYIENDIIKLSLPLNKLIYSCCISDNFQSNDSKVYFICG